MDLKESSVTRRDIDAKLATVGDYVKMDYLQACLKKPLDFDTKKFALVKLAEVYESRRMFLEAAKLIRISADINTTFDSKIKDFVKSMELYIKGGNLDEAEVSFNKAIGTASEKQKANIRLARKTAIKRQADEYLRLDRRRHAMEAYEFLLSTDLDLSEKKEIHQKLLNLYQKLGKVKDYMNLKGGVDSGAVYSPPIAPKRPERQSFVQSNRSENSAQNFLEFN